MFAASSRRTRIAQTCFGRSGRFRPTIRPLFQAARWGRSIGRFENDMDVPPNLPPVHIADAVPAIHHSHTD